MIKDEIDKLFEALKKENNNVVGLIVTDDSGLLIYSKPQSSSSELLGGTIAAVLRKIHNIFKEFKSEKLKFLSLRIDEFDINIIPKERTVSIIISKR
jgi:predicted regulator of Ras-like GTPase activity (Roadblock/LC7/MglB family)